MNYVADKSTPTSWMVPSGMTCTPCPSKPSAHSVWTGSCGWACIDGYNRQGSTCECSAQNYIDAQGNCLQCPAIENGFVTSGTTNRAACTYACNPGFFQYSIGICSPCNMPANMRLLYNDPQKTCAAACIEGYYYSLVSFACLQCGFNQYRAWTPSGGDASCTQVTTLTANQAVACADGNYYVLSKAGPTTDNSWISCVACTPPPSGAYYVRDSFSYMTASVTLPNACVTKACPTSTVAGFYMTGCGGTSMGSLVSCGNGVPYSASTLSGYYAIQTTTETCPVKACAACNAGYYTPDCPVPGGTSPGQCQTCTTIANGVILQMAGIKCYYECNAGFFRYNLILTELGTTPRGCYPCFTSEKCTTPGYYKDASLCVAPVWSYNNAVYVNPATDGDSQCLPCPVVLGGQITMMALPSLPMMGVGACRWECNVGYYLPYSYANFCTTCAPQLQVCVTGQYIIADCAIRRGATTGPQCGQCAIDPNGIASGGPSPLVNNKTACPFTCNAGYWKTGYTCSKHSTIAALCVNKAGFFWSGGNATNDNACVECSAVRPKPFNAYQNVDMTLWLFPGINCSWTCMSGSYLDATRGFCAYCPAGTYKMQESNASLCDPCPPNTYLPTGTSMQVCLQAPGYSTVLSDRSDYACNAGYMRRAAIPNVICAPCFIGTTLSGVMAQLGMATLVFDTSCGVKSFGCVGGLYRSADTANQKLGGAKATCIACPNYNDNGASGTIAPTQDYQNAMAEWAVGLFGSVPSSANCPGDERAYACFAIDCNAGFYKYNLQNCPGMVKTYITMACGVCTQVNCTVGKTQVPCPSSFGVTNYVAQTANTCTACSNPPLVDGMVWTSTTCAWACLAGYFPTPGNATACTPCPIGSYSSSGAACIACAAGYYSAATGASACSACPVGSISSTTRSGLCVSCGVGTFAAATAMSACLPCVAGLGGSIAPFAGASVCAQCIGETPYATFLRDQCTIPYIEPPALCPDGFYVPDYQLTWYQKGCIVCPEGNYCVRSVLYPCPYDAPPAPRMSYAKAQCVETGAPSTCARSIGSAVVPCPANTVNINVRGRTAAWCYPKYGYYGMRGAAATPCPVDSYCPGAASAPIPCPSGTFADAASVGPCTTTMWPPCRPGWYAQFPLYDDGNAKVGPLPCAQCPSGYYCINGGIFACDETSARWWTPPLASSVTDCTVPPTQPVGLVNCPVLADVAQMPSLQMCRAWIPSYPCAWLIAGVTASAYCPRGYYCKKPSVLPIQCPVPFCNTTGKMQIASTCPIQGLSAPLDPCAACTVFPPSNAYFIKGGSCDFCCNAGYFYLAASVVCVKQPTTADCTPGYYATEYPACTVGTLPCIQCPTSLPGAAFASSASTILLVDLPLLTGAASTCLYTCRPGYFPLNASTVQKASVSAGGAGYLRLSSPGCAPCPPGSAGTAMACSNCLSFAGYYTTEYGATACRSCGDYGYATAMGCACVGGSILSATYTLTTQPYDYTYKCTPCSPGAIQSSNTTCSMCPQGKVISPVNDLLQQACASGSFRSNNASICQPCPTGTTSLQQACLTCPPGTFARSNLCMPCPAATYMPFGGATACLNCSISSAIGATACGCDETYYIEDGTCRPCIFRCAGGGGVVRAITPGACSNKTATTAADFTCVCPTGFRGDAFGSPCVRCADAQMCSCDAGSYWNNYSCVKCRTCPPLASTAAACVGSGLTADATVCVCPPLHYHSLPLNLCVPCSVCDRNATTLTTCPAGATADVTACVCKFGAFAANGNNGFVCR